jgi:hypothetical protein
MQDETRKSPDLGNEQPRALNVKPEEMTSGDKRVLLKQQYLQRLREQ